MYQPDFLQTDNHVHWSWGVGNDVWATFVAAGSGDVVELDRLLNREPSLIRCQCEYRTPLHFAVRENQLEAAAFLLNRGADATLGGESGWHDQPLVLARERGFGPMTRLLETHLLETWQICDAGNEIAESMRHRDSDSVRRQVMESGVTVADGRGNQPIHWAVMTRQFEMVDWLLNLGADINAGRADGARPLDLTNGDYWYRGWRDLHPDAPADHWALMDFLLERGAYYDLTTACRRNDTNRVHRILSDDPQSATRDADYNTWYSGYPLRSACKGGFMEPAMLLLEKGADPNRSEHGLAPWGGSLYDAVQNRHVGIVRWLLANNANPNQEVESSGNCYWQADAEIRKILRPLGATFDIFQCVHECHVDDLKKLFRRDPHAANNAEMFTIAAARGHREITDQFLQQQPDIWKRMAARVTMDSGGILIASEFAIDPGELDVNRANWQGIHRLHSGCTNEELAVWVRLGVNIDMIDDEHRATPLGWAARRGDLEFAGQLLDYGADPNACGFPWSRPLAWAERRGHDPVAGLLKKHGARF